LRNSDLRIVHVNTYDVVGGAARAAHALHNALVQRGYVSKMFVATRVVEDPAVVAFSPSKALWKRATRKVRRHQIRRSFNRYSDSRPQGYELFSDDRHEFGDDLVSQLPPCDVINLHWISRFVDYGEFFRGIVHTPVVWSLHDMNAFTGGCHYDDGCGKFETSCGACPQLGSTAKNDLSAQVWARKRRALSGRSDSDLFLVGDSNWMSQQASRSSLLQRFPVRTIHYGLDLNTFRPRDQGFSRATLGIPGDAAVVLFVVDSLRIRRKGLFLLSHALREIVKTVPGLFLLTVGHGELNKDFQDIPHRHLGHIDHDLLLSLVYGAADVLAVPSIQEAFGLTALESTACGTPVVGFDVGGIPDIVHSGETGILVTAGDTKGLGCAISELLRASDERRRMASNCREIAVEEFSLDRMVSEYVDVYNTIRRNVRAGDQKGLL
jgi:glycosyltransferase involved in cell wall biosynthesis